MQRSVERLSMNCIPLHFVCEAVEFFGHVKELECIDIMDPQQVCLCIVWQANEHGSVCRIALWQKTDSRHMLPLIS